MNVKKQKKVLGLVLVTALAVVSCKNKLFDFPPPLNKEPVAAFTSQNVKNSLQVIFSAAGSYDPDGEIVAYTWDFGDGSNGQGIDVFHNYEEAGKYFVELTVTDDDEYSDTVVDEIEVYTSNVLPTAVLATNGTRESVDFVWQFDGSTSYDPDGYIVDYTFKIIRRLDDAPIASFSGNQNLIVYVFKKSHLQEQGETKFEIELTVKDNRGEKAVARKIITVTDP